jgi:hypothetical protein
MTFEEALACGHDPAGARSIAENYCVKCGDLTLTGGAWTDSGNECDDCLDF